MSKSARTRGRRQRQADEKAVAEQAEREALEEAGYPVADLQQARAEGEAASVGLQKTKQHLPGKVVKLDVGAGPRVFVTVELTPPRGA